MIHTMKEKEAGFPSGKKEKLRQKFPIITNKDLRYLEGKEKEMIEWVGYKLGKTNQEMLNIIVEL